MQGTSISSTETTCVCTERETRRHQEFTKRIDQNINLGYMASQVYDGIIYCLYQGEMETDFVVEQFSPLSACFSLGDLMYNFISL